MFFDPIFGLEKGSHFVCPIIIDDCYLFLGVFFFLFILKVHAIGNFFIFFKILV